MSWEYAKRGGGGGGGGGRRNGELIPCSQSCHPVAARNNRQCVSSLLASQALDLEEAARCSQGAKGLSFVPIPCSEPSSQDNEPSSPEAQDLCEGYKCFFHS